CHRHEKPGGTPSLRVEYRCGLTVHREWVCFEHGGYARRKACEWWYRRAPGIDVPDTVAAALRLSGRHAVPSELAIRPSGRFTELVGARFAPCPTTDSAPSAAASPAASAGSIRGSASPTRGATGAASGSAAGSAST